jgi:nucleoside phosphorylase
MNNSSFCTIFSKDRNNGMVRPIQQADVCIICALAEEAHAVEQEISERCQVTFTTSVTDSGRLVYRSTTIRNLKHEPLTLLLLCQTRPGLVYAASDVRLLLDRFQPRFVGMSGICAGDKRHLRLGDLVVAEYAYHFEEGKATRDENGRLVHQPEGITYGPASYLFQYVHPFEAWKAPVTALKRHMFKMDEPPRRLTALMASGMAVHSDDPFAQLQRQHRKTWALDMEAASFYQALRDMPSINGLVVKGVCDHADPFKDDTFHEFAARASAIYLLTFIQQYVTTDTRWLRSNNAVFTIPYQRNLCFTGREELLAQIHGHFASQRVLALCGLGGIGKTEIAIEYAYQYQQAYQAVLWTAASTNAALLSGYAAIADELNLQPKPTEVVKAVKQWLTTKTSWLLILDAASDLAIISAFLPARLNGHVLLTTQAQATGRLAYRIEVDPLPQESGVLFLLRRAGLLAPDADLVDAASIDETSARAICEELAGLPLAIDQAGAYIEEMRCNLSDYQEHYQMHRYHLLKRRGSLIANHLQSVTATFSLAFEQVRQKNEAALELLKFCAFLAPPTIPLSLITQGTVYLGALLGPVAADTFQLDQALETLQAYSLIQRDGKNRTLSVHPLVRAVIQESMTAHEHQKWRVRAMNAAFPETACDRCRKETGKQREKQTATCFDPMTDKEMVIPYRLPLYCDDCQEDLRMLKEYQATFAIARKKATLRKDG